MGTPGGISRRDILKKGAAAGAAFWAVPVIESVTSRAAATSYPTITCSYAIVVYQCGTTYYWARYANTADNTCTPGGNNGGGTGCTWPYPGGPSNGVVIGQFNANASVPNISVNGTPLQWGAMNCTNLTQIGDTITADSTCTILAAVAFGGNTCAPVSLNGTGNGNAVTLIGCV